MPTSLFVEHHANGLAFYINGDLQFDTADEAIYHEYLVVPPIALAVQRFSQPLRVLICGGGDGLAARDALRFPEVGEVILVDYSPAVLELARTVFKPYNKGSLTDDRSNPLGANRVTTYTQDAFQFVADLPDACFHVVICDFTCPTRPEETRIYSREWFQQVQRVLYPNGVVSVNTVSPERETAAFWCLYQTLFAAGLHPKPMQIAIPSFRQHDYGDWGFFLASTEPIERSNLESIALPPNLQVLESHVWLDAFKIPHTIASCRHQVNIHTLEHPQLFYYLLNPPLAASDQLEPNTDECIDFLNLQELGTGTIATQDMLQLDAMVRFWLEQLQQIETTHETPTIEQLIPVQHRYHSPHMTKEWMGYLKSLLTEIDAKQLLTELLKRAQELPPQLARDLKQLTEKVRTGQSLTHLSEHTAELITILSVTLIMANLATPDVVFAKGYSSGGYSSGGSSSYSGEGDRFGWFGFLMMIGGIIWLNNLSENRDD